MQAGPHDFTAATEGQHYETRVRSLAYELWQQEGEPEGRDEEFWLRAEARISAEEAPAPVSSPDEPEEIHDEALAQSFPASDPPAASSGTKRMATAK